MVAWSGNSSLNVGATAHAEDEQELGKCRAASVLTASECTCLPSYPPERPGVVDCGSTDPLHTARTLLRAWRSLQKARRGLTRAATAWCEAAGIQLAPGKMKCMELTKQPHTPVPPALLYTGQEIRFMCSTRCLGLECAAWRGLGPTCADCWGRIHGAWAKLKLQYGKLCCQQSVWLLLQLC